MVLDLSYPGAVLRFKVRSEVTSFIIKFVECVDVGEIHIDTPTRFSIELSRGQFWAESLGGVFQKDFFGDLQNVTAIGLGKTTYHSHLFNCWTDGLNLFEIKNPNFGLQLMGGIIFVIPWIPFNFPENPLGFGSSFKSRFC
jgi:hypothetical protein